MAEIFFLLFQGMFPPKILKLESLRLVKMHFQH